MNAHDKATMYGWTAVILAIVLLGVGIVWWKSADNSLQTNTDKMQGNLSYYKAQIREKCAVTATTTAAEKKECGELLGDLSEMLRDYRTLLSQTSPTSTAPTSTVPSTTPPTPEPLSATTSSAVKIDLPH